MKGKHDKDWKMFRSCRQSFLLRQFQGIKLFATLLRWISSLPSFDDNCGIADECVKKSALNALAQLKKFFHWAETIDFSFSFRFNFFTRNFSFCLRFPSDFQLFSQAVSLVSKLKTFLRVNYSRLPIKRFLNVLWNFPIFTAGKMGRMWSRVHDWGGKN